MSGTPELLAYGSVSLLAVFSVLVVVSVLWSAGRLRLPYRAIGTLFLFANAWMVVVVGGLILTLICGRPL